MLLENETSRLNLYLVGILVFVMIRRYTRPFQTRMQRPLHEGSLTAPEKLYEFLIL